MVNITYIYLVTNCYGDPNKVYVGKTTNIKNRKSRHKKKYGRNINFDIIDEIDSLDKKDWKPLETYWINKVMVWKFNIMNIRKEGGSGSTKWTEKQKANRRGKGMGPNPKISKAKLNHIGTSKPILQYDLEGNFIKEWPSISEATRNINNSDIPSCLSGKQSQAGGFIWIYKEGNILNNIPKFINKRGKSKAKCRTIIQYSLKDEFIKEWESGKHAALVLKKNQPDISACCKGKLKTAGGFKWKFK